jgi:hypothetical protein
MFGSNKAGVEEHGTNGRSAIRKDSGCHLDFLRARICDPQHHRERAAVQRAEQDRALLSGDTAMNDDRRGDRCPRH